MPKRMRQVYLDNMRERYQNAPKSLKTKILSEFCVNSGYSRKHASRILSGKLEPRKNRPGPKVKYGPEVVDHLKYLWEEMGCICSKKVKSALPLWLPHYSCPSRVKDLLVQMAPSTIDKKLNPYRGPKQKGKGTTKGLKSMMKRIPLKILGDDIKTPGFMEMDTVAHCGDDIAGKYAHSLTMTDLMSGWTENGATWTKEASEVVKAIKKIEKRLPFKLTGVSSDNGTEFLNNELCDYLFKREKPISFVRGRAYKKNDNAHVEQKNYTHVRELFAYERYDNFELSVMMDEIYKAYWSPLQNYFIPNLKLISKERHGSRVVKKYDTPKTPAQRLIESDRVSKQVKKQLNHKPQIPQSIYAQERATETIKDLLLACRTTQKKKAVNWIMTNCSLRTFTYRSIRSLLIMISSGEAI